MPGLVAIISPSPNPQHERDVETMLQATRHEAHYKSGTYFDRECGLYIGWTCLPGTYCDCLPIRSRNSDLLLFFYGEHHSSHSHRPRSAASLNAYTVLDLFERDGCLALEELNGWFHGILLDRRSNRILVFNDRLGMQRLYYSRDNESTLIAAEAKCLLRIRSHLRNFDTQGLADFLSCGAVLEDRTLFKNIHRLEAATKWEFARGASERKSRYFRADTWENQSPISEGELELKLQDLLPVLTAQYAQSPLPVGVALTGGYDTRLLLSYMNGSGSAPTCYTFGGLYRDCFDVKIARKVAANCGYNHETLSLNSAFFSNFSRLAEKTVYISDGQLGACNAYELYFNHLASKIAPVKLTGSFGSEVMRGGRAFRAQPGTQGLFRQEFSLLLNESVKRFAERSTGHPLSFSVFMHGPLYYFNRLAIEQSQVVVRTPFLDNSLVGLMFRSPMVFTDRRAMTRRLIERGNGALAKMPTDTGNTSLLKHWLLQFLFQADYCYKSGMPQWLEQLHYIARPLRPERWLIGHHRFQHFRIWFRSQLSEYVRGILLDHETLNRPYFEKRFLEQMVTRHIKGDRNFTDDIERVLTVELTHRTLLSSH